MAFIKTTKGRLYYKPVELYLGLKKINKEISKVNLKLIKKYFDENDLYFVLGFGTLLGAIRDNDFIEHDEDIDLFILEEDEDKLKNLLWNIKDIGFELIRYDKRGLYTVMKDGEYIDFYVFRKYKKYKGIVHSGSDYILEYFLTDTINYNFLGDEYRIPKDYQTFLALHYGDNWMTPVVWSTYDLPKYKIIKLRIISKIKRNLPKCIFDFMQERNKNAVIRRQRLFERARKMGLL